jgi:Fe-S oxidoreductase
VRSKEQERSMPAVTPMLELTDLILEIGGHDLQVCMQCGTCTAVCPWPPLKLFSARHVIRLASLGLEGYEQEDLWNCVTCNTCVLRCPRGVDVIDVMRAARSVMLEAGTFPETYRAPLASLRSDGTPWSGSRSERCAWAEGLDLPVFDGDKEFLYFTCCTQAYDPRNRQVARALVGILGHAGVSFGVLGEAESCCGDQARKVGAEETYADLKQANLELFSRSGVRKAIVASPHCMQVMNLDYADAVELEAVHYTQLLDRLVAEGALRLEESVEEVVTYHDPCYLGRHAGEYEAPRRLLGAIPGLELREMPRNRETSLCCGGGGGGLWMDLPIDQRFAVHRVREARETGARIIATACPYCTSMLEDAVKILDLEDEIEVRDVAELVARALPAKGR